MLTLITFFAAASSLTPQKSVSLTSLNGKNITNNNDNEKMMRKILFKSLKAMVTLTISASETRVVYGISFSKSSSEIELRYGLIFGSK